MHWDKHYYQRYKNFKIVTQLKLYKPKNVKKLTMELF